jgi:hypothetical protein
MFLESDPFHVGVADLFVGGQAVGDGDAVLPGWSAASPPSRSPPTSTGSGWRHCAVWSTPVSCGTQVEAVMPLDQARQALAQVASRHTRGKIVLQIGS